MARTSIGGTRTLALLVGVSCLMAASCTKDPYDPQTWIDKLDDAEEFEAAVTQLEQMRCPEAIKALGKTWEKHNRSSRVLRAMINIADQPDTKAGSLQDCKDEPDGPFWKDAIPILVKAVEDFDEASPREIDDATFAADALGRAKDPETVQALISVATRDKIPKLSQAQRVRIASVRALGSFGDNPRAVETLVNILGTPVDDQPIQLNAAAANALALTKSEKAVEPLLAAMYEISPIYQQVRTALTMIGEPVVKELLLIMDGKHAGMNKLSEKHDFAKKAPGNLRFKAAALLGDLRSKKAVPVILAALQEEPKTSFFDPKTGAPGPPDHSAFLDALRNIGDQRAVEPLAEYMKSDKTLDEVRAMAIDTYSMLSRDTKELDWLDKKINDVDEEQQVRSAASLAYSRLVRSKGQLKIFNKIIDAETKRAKENDDKAAKAKDAKKKEEFEGVAGDSRRFAREYEQYRVRASIGIECGDNVECYAEMLEISGEDLVKRLKIPNHRKGDMKKQDMADYRVAAVERAMLEVAKLGKKARNDKVMAALFEHAKSTDRIVRQGVLLALVNVAEVPCEECVKRLDEIIEAQKDQTTLDYLTSDTRIVRNYFAWAGGAGGGGGGE